MLSVMENKIDILHLVGVLHKITKEVMFVIDNTPNTIADFIKKSHIASFPVLLSTQINT